METVVLMAVRNASGTVVDAIESVVGQDNVQIVFVDDASTDNTAVLAQQKLYDLRCKYGIRYWFMQNKERQGVASCINLGFSFVEDEDAFITRLDGDDVFLCDAISNLKQAYKPGTFVASNYVERSNGVDMHRAPKSIYECLACGVLMRIQDIKKAGGLARQNIGMFIEYDLYARLIALGVQPTIINKQTYLYNRHGNNMTNNKEAVTESLNQFEKIWGPDLTSKIRRY